MKTGRFLSAGLMDAGLASVSTFAVGVYAARTLAAGDLGLFALHFSAFLLVSTLSHQGLFIPLEARAAASAHPLRFARRSRALSWVPLLLAPAVVVLAGAAAPGPVPATLGLSAAAAAALSPLQDHLRRFLHLAGLSWSAVSVSFAQAVSVGAALFVLHPRLDPLALPFGALALANLVSLTVASVLLGFRLVRESGEGDTTPLPGVGVLFGSGRWLLGAQLSAAAAAFLAAAAVGRLGSMEALGWADAARIVARPVLVLTTGMTAVLGPRLMRAGGSRSDEEGRGVGTLYRKTIVFSVAAYVILFGWDHALNPLAWLVPAAYEIPLLVLVTCVANGWKGAVIPARFEAIGGGRARALFRVDLLAGGVQVASAALAGITQAFTIPLGNGLFALMRQWGLRAVRTDLYAPEAGAGSPDSVDRAGEGAGRPERGHRDRSTAALEARVGARPGQSLTESETSTPVPAG